MFFTPASVLRVWLCGLLSLAVLGLGISFLLEWYEELPRTKAIAAPDGSVRADESQPLNGPFERMAAWRPGWDEETALLAGAAALIGWTFFGRFFSPRLWRRRGEDEPNMARGGEERRIQRPDGAELQVEMYGPADAPPVILTHGWSCDSTEWYYLKRRLSDRFRVIVWDLPGLGRTTQPANRDFSLEKMAHDLRAVLEETTDRPAVLVGHSIGGMIMLTFCRLFPDLLDKRIAGLVMTNTTYTNPLRTMAFSGLFTVLQKPVIEPLLHLTIWISPLVWLMNVLSYWNGSAHWSSELEAFAGTETRGQLDFAARYLFKASPAVSARGSFGMLKYDATDVLPRIDTPALVVTGDRDPVTRPEAGERIDAALPQSRRFPLSPAKHLGLIEHYGEFLELTEQFLDSLELENARPKRVVKAEAASKDLPSSVNED